MAVAKVMKKDVEPGDQTRRLAPSSRLFRAGNTTGSPPRHRAGEGRRTSSRLLVRSRAVVARSGSKAAGTRPGPATNFRVSMRLKDGSCAPPEGNWGGGSFTFRGVGID